MNAEVMSKNKLLPWEFGHGEHLEIKHFGIFKVHKFLGRGFGMVSIFLIWHKHTGAKSGLWLIAVDGKIFANLRAVIRKCTI